MDKAVNARAMRNYGKWVDEINRECTDLMSTTLRAVARGEISQRQQANIIAKLTIGRG